MIFHNHKTIFFHIGKTAGTSVEILLGRQSDTADLESFFGLDPTENFYLQHSTPAFIKSRISTTVFDSYFKFTVVRNPFVRSLSVFYYLVDQHTKQFGSFENYVHALPELVKQDRLRHGSHHVPQIDHTRVHGKSVCDHIAHFETLPHSLDFVRTKLGITKTLETHNQQRYHDWGSIPLEDHYSNEMIEILVGVYQEDFDEFGYSTDLTEITPVFESSS